MDLLLYGEYVFPFFSIFCFGFLALFSLCFGCDIGYFQPCTGQLLLPLLCFLLKYYYPPSLFNIDSTLLVIVAERFNVAITGTAEVKAW